MLKSPFAFLSPLIWFVCWLEHWGGDGSHRFMKACEVARRDLSFFCVCVLCGVDRYVWSILQWGLLRSLSSLVWWGSSGAAYWSAMLFWSAPMLNRSGAVSAVSLIVLLLLYFGDLFNFAQTTSKSSVYWPCHYTAIIIFLFNWVWSLGDMPKCPASFRRRVWWVKKLVRNPHRGVSCLLEEVIRTCVLRSIPNPVCRKASELSLSDVRQEMANWSPFLWISLFFHAFFFSPSPFVHAHLWRTQ